MRMHCPHPPSGGDSSCFAMQTPRSCHYVGSPTSPASCVLLSHLFMRTIAQPCARKGSFTLIRFLFEHAMGTPKGASTTCMTGQIKSREKKKKNLKSGWVWCWHGRFTLQGKKVRQGRIKACVCEASASASTRGWSCRENGQGHAKKRGGL